MREEQLTMREDTDDDRRRRRRLVSNVGVWDGRSAGMMLQADGGEDGDDNENFSH